MGDAILRNYDPCIVCKALKPIMVTEFSKTDKSIVTKICYDCFKGRKSNFYCCICKQKKSVGDFSKNQRKKRNKKCSNCLRYLDGKKRKRTNHESSRKRRKND